MYDVASMPSQIDIGFTGEKKFRKIEIDMTKWMTEMPNGIPSIVHIRPEETTDDAYIAATTFENNILTWEISAGDLGTVEGVGTAQVWLEEEENDSVVKRGKSVLFATMIHGAINDASEETPASQAAFMEQMTALKVATILAAEEAQEAAVHGPTIDGETGNWLVWDQTSMEYVDTGITSRGQLGAKSIVFELDDVENTSGSYSHSTEIDAATNTMKPIALEVGSPNVFGGNITVTCNNGSITVSCDSVSGESTLKVICEEMAQSPYEPFVTSEEYAVLNGRIGDLGDLETTDKDNLVDAINEVVENSGTGIIDDTAGEGDTDKVWSADKTAGEFSDVLNAINGKYTLPSGGIPSTDLASGVQTSLGKADTAYQKPQTGIPASDLASGVIPTVPVTDVQVNGTSILSDGVANVPISGSSALGVIKSSSSFGIYVDGSDGTAYISKSTDDQCKAGTQLYKPIVPANEHNAVFYGLAKSAGDTTQSSSSNAVGVYTESAMSSIDQMLHAPVSVSGSTPSITAKAGCRYVCGECSTLTIVVPASGIIDVTFTSGSTATVLTITPPTGQTVKWANGFDPTSLDANTTYELNIMDLMGVVGSWT